MPTYRPTNPSGSATGRPTGQGLTGSEETRFRVGRGGGTYRYTHGKDSVNVFIEDDVHRKTLVILTDAGWVEFGVSQSGVVECAEFRKYKADYVNGLGATLDTGLEVWSIQSDRCVSSKGSVRQIGTSIPSRPIAMAWRDDGALIVISQRSENLYSDHVITITEVTEGGAQSANFDPTTVLPSGTDVNMFGAREYLAVGSDGQQVIIAANFGSHVYGNSATSKWFDGIAPFTFRIDLTSLEGTLHIDPRPQIITENYNRLVPISTHPVTVVRGTTNNGTVATESVYVIHNTAYISPATGGTCFKSTAILGSETISVNAPDSFYSSTERRNLTTRSYAGSVYEHSVYCGDTYNRIQCLTFTAGHEPLTLVTYTASNGTDENHHTQEESVTVPVYRIANLYPASFTNPWDPVFETVVSSSYPVYQSYGSVTAVKAHEVGYNLVVDTASISHPRFTLDKNVSDYTDITMGDNITGVYSYKVVYQYSPIAYYTVAL